MEEQQQMQQQQQQSEQYSLYGHAQEQSHPSHILTAQPALLVGSQCIGLSLKTQCWIADSGTTTFMTNNPTSLYNLPPLRPRMPTFTLGTVLCFKYDMQAAMI